MTHLPKIQTCVVAMAIALACTGSISTTLAADTLRVTDMTGRELMLDGPAQRVVSIIVPTAATIVAIDGSPEKLIGVNPIAMRMFRSGIIGKLFPEALSIRSNITQGGAGIFVPNVEELVALDPDIVIQAGYAGEQVVKPLVNAGINTALYMSGGEERMRAAITMIGAVLGKPERAKMLNDWRAKTIARIKSAAQKIADGERVKILQVMATPTGFRVWGKQTIANDAIRLAGAVNAAADVPRLKPVNTEQIAKWAPDVIFIFNVGRANRQSVLGHTLLSTTPAARSGRVYRLPTGSINWGSAGVDDPLYFAYVAALAYPRIHAGGVAGDIQRWYTKIYGKPVSHEQIAKLLHAKENGAAPNYDLILGRSR